MVGNENASWKISCEPLKYITGLQTSGLGCKLERENETKKSQEICFEEIDKNFV